MDNLGPMTLRYNTINYLRTLGVGNTSAQYAIEYIISLIYKEISDIKKMSNIDGPDKAGLQPEASNHARGPF